MFGVILATVLPSIFPASTFRSSHTPGAFSYAGKGTNNWTPSHSGKGYTHEIHMADITAGTGISLAKESEKHFPEGSEEGKMRGGEIGLSSMKSDDVEKVIKGEGIKLTTTYRVKYDDEESLIDTRQSHKSKVSMEGSTRLR